MTERPKVVVTHRVDRETLDMLSGSCAVDANQSPDTLPPAEILARCRDADAAIVFMPDAVDRAFLHACSRLRIIAGALRGYDNFDIAACTEAGVWFCVVPELLAGPTAELGLGLLLALARRIPEGDAFVRSGRFVGWRPQLYGRGIAERTIGILGLGQLGRALAQRLVGFEARVRYYDTRRASDADEKPLELTWVEYDDVLQSDYLIVALPLTPATLHLIDERALSSMPSGAFLINLSRGSVVNERDVAMALESGRLAGYAADVYEFEDWARPDRAREVPPEFLRATKRTVLTPHLGSAVTDVRKRIELAAARSVLQALASEIPGGAVNRPAARDPGSARYS